MSDRIAQLEAECAKLRQVAEEQATALNAARRALSVALVLPKEWEDFTWHRDVCAECRHGRPCRTRELYEVMVAGQRASARTAFQRP